MDDIRSYAEVGRALHKICITKCGKQSVTSIAWSREPQTSQCFGKSQRIRNHPILFPHSLYPQMSTSGHRFFRGTASLLQSANSSLAQGSPWQSSDTFASAFQRTGIFPYNPDIFADWMFVAAETTNRPPPAEENKGHSENHTVAETEEHLTPPSSPTADFERPGTSKQLEAPTQRKSVLSVSVEDIYPLPRASALSTTTRKPRKKKQDGRHQFDPRY
jgi:hypothetical protein